MADPDAVDEGATNGGELANDALGHVAVFRVELVRGDAVIVNEHPGQFFERERRRRLMFARHHLASLSR